MSSDLSPPVCSNGSTGNIADASGAEVIISAAALSKYMLKAGGKQ